MNSSESRVYTTQQTAKRYKAMQLLGVTLTVASIGLVFGFGKIALAFAALLAVVGFLLIFTGALLSWWHHG